jgi:small subunit ribosomal protein S8
MSPIANMLVQIKNAQSAGLENVAVPFSEMKFRIAEILKNKGFIENVEKKKKKAHKVEVDFLNIELKYKDGVGAINDIKLISKPSRRMYAGKEALRQVKSGYGISVISTSKGLMTGDDAKKNGIGGETIFEIW